MYKFTQVVHKFTQVVHKFTQVFLSPMARHICSWSDVCLFLFLLSFPAFFDQTRALPQVFLLTVYTTGVKISRIFFESDEYLCPLTVQLHQV